MAQLLIGLFRSSVRTFYTQTWSFVGALGLGAKQFSHSGSWSVNPVLWELADPAPIVLMPAPLPGLAVRVGLAGRRERQRAVAFAPLDDAVTGVAVRMQLAPTHGATGSA
jgi:hypothetical protein